MDCSLGSSNPGLYRLPREKNTIHEHCLMLPERKWKLLSCVQLFATSWTTQSMKFSRPQPWSVSLLQGSFPIQESNRDLLHCRQILYQLSYQGSLMLLNTHGKQKQIILLSLVKSLYTLLSDVIVSIVGPRHLLLGQFTYWFLLIMLISGRKNVTFSVHCLREKNSQNKWLKMKKINQQYCYLIHKITPTTNLPT